MPQNSRLSIGSWHDLMKCFSWDENDATYHVLIKAYSEKHRAYHTLDHIEACFRHLDKVYDQAKHPHEIELALWFHDAVYKPFSSRNEEDSAYMARAFLVQNQTRADIIERICDLIILTKEHNLPSSIDGKLMLDIDLSILGASERVYAQFEKDVRREYKRIPSFVFKKKRKEILQTFIARSKIYQTDYFFARFEKQAKKNLSWAIGNL